MSRLTVVLDGEGQVWIAGSNDYGRLGLGHTDDQEDLTLVNDLPRIVMVADRYDHCLALDEEGYVWGWGINDYYQVTSNEEDHLLHPVKLNLKDIQSIHCNTVSSAALDRQGRLTKLLRI
jgi:alpha-tubulin suppressor-like RCC1 family protein